MSAESLARYVRQRRYDLRITQQAIEDNGGPSVATMRTIETGKSASLRSSTGKRLDKALSWPEGTALKLLRDDIQELEQEAYDDVDPRLARDVLRGLIHASVAAGRMRVLSGGIR
ncbi:hypothetical protein [Kibdelosporangium phytohabitans]|uniref:HTH cro/C1-type domain-containing protein n=1 Tax=Kibdelosporangium phytohabitans TaxID=860235 RepID=A0A0N9HX84_9PSEU|nr:hypothetical protein [Kibdelosporangium phytohabitans]ALG06819.1 hypothetical protein AOZ06_07655 [Kibdelosporangium phytohabitans]MBE1468062.1 hypothetical protein [Kibdelosporangium phytohabitans]